MCYKHELLLSVEATVAREEIGLALQPILLGPLNPLKFCLDNVVCEFERLALCDCAQARMLEDGHGGRQWRGWSLLGRWAWVGVGLSRNGLD